MFPNWLIGVSLHCAAVATFCCSDAVNKQQRQAKRRFNVATIVVTAFRHKCIIKILRKYELQFQLVNELFGFRVFLGLAGPGYPPARDQRRGTRFPGLTVVVAVGTIGRYRGTTEYRNNSTLQYLCRCWSPVITISTRGHATSHRNMVAESEQ